MGQPESTVLCGVDEHLEAGAAVAAFGAWMSDALGMTLTLSGASSQDALAAAASELGASYVVVAADPATRERAEPETLTLLRESPCPVIALPPRAARAWWMPHRARKNLRPLVVAGTDGSWESVAGAAHAGEIASRMRGTVIVANALAEPSHRTPSWARDGEDPLAWAGRVDRARQIGAARLAAQRPAVRVNVRYVSGDPVTALEGLAWESMAALIAVGSRGLGRERLALAGSVSASLLQLASVPVLVVPPSAAAPARPAEKALHASTEAA
jgi:nucleotide-binding universal stress UspA family protein